MADNKFFNNHGPFSLQDIAEKIGCELVGSPLVMIEDIATLKNANQNHITFLSNRKYLEDFKETKAGACICDADAALIAPRDLSLLISKNPYYSYAALTQLFYSELREHHTVSKSAAIHETAELDKCSIGEFTAIGAHTKIGKDVIIGSNVSIKDGVTIGDKTIIGDNVTISHSIIGRRCNIYSGARIGQDGFGFAPGITGIKKVLQLGRVIIADDVEVGANSTIDRGAIEDTEIGAGTKIDNLVQIGHNVRIGKNCFIVAQAGIAGSTVIGDNVMIAGQAGIAGHLSIADGTMIAAQSGVISNISEKQTVGGTPALPIKQWHRMTAVLKKMAQGNKGD